MQSHLTESVEEFIDSGAEPTQRMICDLVDCELAYINTDHPSFIGGSKAISMIMERRSKLAESGSDDEAPAKPKHGSAGDLVVAQTNKAAGDAQNRWEPGQPQARLLCVLSCKCSGNFQWRGHCCTCLLIQVHGNSCCIGCRQVFTNSQ